MVTLSRIDVLLNSVRDDLVKLREQYPIPTVDGLRVIDPNQLTVVVFENEYTDEAARSQAQIAISDALVTLESNEYENARNTLRAYIHDKAASEDSGMGNLEATTDFLLESLLCEFKLGRAESINWTKYVRHRGQAQLVQLISTAILQITTRFNTTHSDIDSAPKPSVLHLNQGRGTLKTNKTRHPGKASALKTTEKEE